MSKITGLRAAHELLSISRNHCARAHLLGWTKHPDDPPREAHLVACSLLLAELEDHLHNLAGITEACTHGLAGTVPDEHPLAPEDFDPWAAAAAFLHDEYRLPVAVLGPELLAWLDAWPERERRTSARLLELFGPDSAFFANTHGEDGRRRRATEAERAQAPERNMLAGFERTAFTLSYAADLAEVAALVEQRGPLARILALVE